MWLQGITRNELTRKDPKTGKDRYYLATGLVYALSTFKPRTFKALKLWRSFLCLFGEDLQTFKILQSSVFES